MSNNEAFHAKLRQLETELPQLFERLPGIGKVDGEAFIADNFRNEGFEVKKGQHNKWQKKKPNRKGEPGRKPTLIGEKRGGALRRSWQGKPLQNKVVFESALPYAGVHNDGLRAGRPPGFIMPQRQMIGHSDALIGRIEDKLDRMVEQILSK